MMRICAQLPAVFLLALLLGASAGARAAAPTGRYIVGADTVVDTVSRLTWQRAVASSTYTFSAAGAYCQTVSLGGFASGWRLPTIKELR